MQGFKFRLRGLTWTVELKPELEGGALGLCRYEPCVLQIKSTLSPDQIRATFWHEFGHACFAPNRGSRVDTNLDAIDEELACNLLGDGMVELLQQHKKFPLWLTIKGGIFE